ncbi:FAD-binding domain-containing protein [Mycena sanguinolenta]|uniref:FAD-binding domain-containing protein n=1 Tax=Mycena sanguinolenta TaxID=230812 RepID=A0A8H7CN16_9AGAR|nr:FAD-binding domain-containing protein [Mycena sanguinolenta]
MNILLGLCYFSPVVAAITLSLTDQWQALNATVGGRLHAATPFALPCFSKYNNQSVEVDEGACSTIQANYTNPQYRLTSFSANMNPQYETCMATHSQCLLNSANSKDTLATNGISCDQGQISPFYIDVRTPEDVQAAYKFSASTKIPLSIKNTGHDYIGRTRRAGSLGIWTHNLDSMRYHTNFTPDSCNGSFRAITVGAGVTFEQVYKFADDNDAMFVGGYAQSIGASGGWLMGGGHSVLSPSLGLGVDRVVRVSYFASTAQHWLYHSFSFKSRLSLQMVSSARPTHANIQIFSGPCAEGGGGTFGVVLESTHLVEQRIPIQVVNITYAPAEAQLQRYFEILVNSSTSWSELGWGGHITSRGLIYVNPQLSLADATESMQQIAEFARANGGSATFETLPSWYDFFDRFILQVQAAVGNLRILGSRLIPKANFETKAGRVQLVAHLLNQTAMFGLPYIPVVTPISYTYIPGTTSLSPAWRTALWHLGTSTTWAYNSTIDEIRGKFSSVHDFVDKNLRTLAPDSGSYLNEGDVYETDYEVAYWGANYARLLEVKIKYDPMGLLDCWNCVGSKGPSEFPCYPVL